MLLTVEGSRLSCRLLSNTDANATDPREDNQSASIRLEVRPATTDSADCEAPARSVQVVPQIAGTCSYAMIAGAVTARNGRRQRQFSVLLALGQGTVQRPAAPRTRPHGAQGVPLAHAPALASESAPTAIAPRLRAPYITPPSRTLHYQYSVLPTATLLRTRLPRPRRRPAAPFTTRTVRPHTRRASTSSKCAWPVLTAMRQGYSARPVGRFWKMCIASLSLMRA